MPEYATLKFVVFLFSYLLCHVICCESHMQCSFWINSPGDESDDQRDLFQFQMKLQFIHCHCVSEFRVDNSLFSAFWHQAMTHDLFSCQTSHTSHIFLSNLIGCFRISMVHFMDTIFSLLIPMIKYNSIKGNFGRGKIGKLQMIINSPKSFAIATDKLPLHVI